mmetsp:Transcript_61720/g.137793  ORF Transcript_61720/g.137793 Transcript_61720/m.137793 type:complete len:271 (+) Transcript_61720:24-836(+)
MASASRASWQYVSRLYRSLRDATRHRQLSAPTDGQRYPVPEELLPLESDSGQSLVMDGAVNQSLVSVLLRQDHPAFCAVASAMTIARAENAGPFDQKKFMTVFREGGRHGAAWPNVMATYGLDALDGLPAPVKYWLLCHLQYDGAPMALLAEWFRLLGFSVDVVSSSAATEETFRADVAAAFPQTGVCGSGRNYILVNYSRSAVGQRMFSGGHYAPLGGFHHTQDKVLLLEVNSWRYPSVWVDLPRLWGATHTQVANGSWRGYLRIRTAE